MKQKYLSLILFLLCIIPFISGMYPGETYIYEHNLETDNLQWIIIDNTSELNVLPIISINSTHLNLILPDNMPPNSFIIVFIEEQTNEKVVEVQVNLGGGGSSIKYINKTKYAEVPNYITNYVNNSEDTSKMPQNEAETGVQDTIKEKWGLFTLFIVFIIGLTYLLKYRTERR